MGDPTSIITAGSEQVAQLAFDKLKKQINYIFNYKENLERYKDLYNKLENQQKEVEERVRDAENKSNEEPVESVTEWLNRAKEKLNSETNAELLRGENERKAAEKCCFGYVGWNPKYRHSLSRRAVKKAEDIEKVLKEMNDRGPIPMTRPAGPPSLGSIQGKFFDGLKSRKDAVDRIMDVLKKNNNVNRIGLHGMGGAGKSTIVKEIARRAEKEKIFQNILLAEISQSPDIKYIQQCLAERIDFSLDKSHNENERALKLNAALKKKLRGRDQTKTSIESSKDEVSSKLLIILDNIWDSFDPETLGIGNELQNDPQCKIIVTSRRENVCKEMGVASGNMHFVGTLNDDEAKLLFEEGVGDLAKNKEYKDVMEKIMLKCSRLPLSITVLAKSLKNQNIDLWKEVVQKLDNSVGGESEERVPYNVRSILKMSFDFICSENVKMFFLLCCIFPPGEKILFWDLLEFGIGMELFHYVTSLSEAIREAHGWIEDLRSSSLLEVDYDGEIKIHDEVREVGISIAALKEKGKFYVGACSSWLSEKLIEECSIISIMASESYEYFNNLNMPELQLLCMRKTTLSSLTCTCFKNIKVLDLSESTIEEFPLSIEVIRDLRTLILNKCSKLKDTTHVCVLVKLRILSLKESKVESLPKEIGNLVKLKLLDLTSCEMIKEISVGTLASLTQLEALLMRDSFNDWQSKETMASIYELKSLPLKVLEIDVRSMKQLSAHKEYKIPTLLFFGIRIGCVHDPSSSSYNVLSSPGLFINGANTCDLFKEVLMDLSNKVTVLYLENIVGLKRIVATPDEGRLENEFEVGEVCCGQEDCLIKAKAIREWDMSSFQDGFSVLDKFQSLQEVELVNLTELESYALRPENAKKLKNITIKGCEKLKYIFSRSKTNENDDIELPSLKGLMLINLPSLKGFYDRGEHATDRSTSLFTKKVKLPALTLLCLKRISKLKYIWDEEFCQASDMVNLKILDIRDCNLLESVCTTSIVKGLRHLEILYLKDCESMTQVISTEVGRQNESTPNEILIFSELFTLKLSGLSNLTCFFQESTKIKPHLSNNEVEVGNRREKILFSSKKVLFPSLMEMKLHAIPNIEILWDKATSEELPKLEIIKLKEMSKLKRISSEASDIQLIEGLKYFKVRLCDSVESLISFFHILPQLSFSSNKIIFSNLVDLTLEGINMFERNLNVEFPVVRSLWLSKISLEASLKTEKNDIQPDKSADEQEDERSMIQVLFNKKVKFPSLKILGINEIPKLKRLFDCSTEEEDEITIFSKLTHFVIGGCTSMRYLFSKKLLAGLRNLEALAVSNCDSLEELFEVEDEEEQRDTERKIILLPKLKTLDLRGLPKLKLIPWQILPSLQSLTIYVCFRNNYRKSLIPTTASSDSMTRGGRRQIPLFQNLEVLKIGGCDNVETVLVGSVGGDQEESLPAVEDVSVTHQSGSQEDVSATKDQYHAPVIAFPKLQKITIKYMEHLRSFISSAGHDEVHFPSLQSVKIIGCYRMRLFSSMKAVAPKLASIKIDEKDMIEEADGGTDDRLNSTLLHFDPIKNVEKLWPNTLNHMAHHQHQLIRFLVLAFYFDPKCNECETKFVYGEVAYCCDECRFYMCSTCALDRLSDQLVEVPNQLEVSRNWPKSLKHELHAHELQLLIARGNNCDGCKKKIWDVFLYRCKECDFDLHPNCALRPTEKLKDDDKVTAELEVITGSKLSVHQIQTDATDSTTPKPSASVPFLIGGDFVESQSSQFINVINPATQEVISRVPLATKDDLNVAILVADEAFPLWRDTSITARQQIMFKFQDLIVRDMNKLASSITNEQGKVLKDAVRDVLHVQELVGNVCGMTTFQMEEFVSNGFTKSLGIYVGICTSNLPIMISVWELL